MTKPIPKDKALCAGLPHISTNFLLSTILRRHLRVVLFIFRLFLRSLRKLAIKMAQCMGLD
jgi:hypothetical protein